MHEFLYKNGKMLLTREEPMLMHVTIADIYR